MATNNSNTRKNGAASPKTKKRLTKKERQARQKKRMILFGIEAVLIVVLATILFLVTKVDKMEATEIDESEITFNQGIGGGTDSENLSIVNVRFFKKNAR